MFFMGVFPRPTVPVSPDPVEKDEVFSVSEFISLLNIKLKPLRATIQGEMGEVKYSGKAVYFTLKNRNEAILKCLVFRH